MWITRLAWKNLWRNKGRTLITVAAIFFAVILSTTAESLKQGIFDNLVKNVVSFYTGYMQVHKTGYEDEQVLDNSFTGSKELERKILAEENVDAVTPRLESFSLISNEELTKGGMVVGIDPLREHSITFLRDRLIKGQYLQESDQAVLIAAGLAERLSLDVHDTVILLGQGYHGATAAAKYPVNGIVKFGSPQLNERMVYLPLKTAQEFFSAEGQLTSYVLSVESDSRLDQSASSIRYAIGDEFEVMTWGELMPDIKQHIQSDSNSMRIIQGILYLLICFGIFSTLLMMMLERKYEMGMLVAIGMKKTTLALLFIGESVLTVVIGCIAGILASIPIIFYLNRHPLRLGGEMAEAYERFGFEAILPTSTNGLIFFNQALIVSIIGLLLAMYPVYKVVRLNPVHAMKK